MEQQKKILSLFYNVEQIDTKAEYYQVGSKYDIEANTENYTVSKLYILHISSTYNFVCPILNVLFFSGQESGGRIPLHVQSWYAAQILHFLHLL